MPAGTAFTSSVDGTSYQFVTIADITALISEIQLHLIVQVFMRELMLQLNMLLILQMLNKDLYSQIIVQIQLH